MNTQDRTPARRKRVERNIYKRADGKYEIGFRDSDGIQRWRDPNGPPSFDTITAARKALARVQGAKAKGERVQPNPRLTFGAAADRWLVDQVSDLRPATQASYRNSIEVHLRPRWSRRRLDSITVDDVARAVRELRAEGKAENSIGTIMRAATRVFKFARRRLGWHGEIPTVQLENGERPRISQAARQRIFQGDELAQTLAAASEPWRTLFAFAAVSGARLSEVLGLVWADVELADISEATVSIAFQADRDGRRVALKTDSARRTIELPRSLAALLLEHRLRCGSPDDSAFVFASRSGRALGQRNVLRELRRAQKAAVDAEGGPTFPALQESGPVPPRSVPTFHSFRHTAASEAIAAGDSAEEVSWQLGHKNSVVTRAIYVQQIRDAERTAKRRARMEARYGSVLEAAGRNGTQQAETQDGEVVDLARVRGGTQ